MRGTMDIFAIRDRKTAYICFTKDSPNFESFERWFVQNLLVDSKTIFSMFPEDYDIYKLCDYDPSSMVVTAPKGPKLYGSVSDLFDKFHLARPSLAQSSDEA